MPIRQTHLDIQGMSYANCATTITETLTDLTEVSNATVNLATDEGTVEYDPEHTSLAEVYDAVEDAGYSVERRSVTIGISDMTCSNCASTNEQAVDDVPGVSDAEVNFATDEARVKYNPADVSVDTLYDAIEDAGYQPVREPESEDQSEQDEQAQRESARNQEVQRQLRLTLFGAALSLPLVFFLFEELFIPTLVLDAPLEIPLGWIAFLFATPVQIVLGKEFYENSYKAVVRNQTANMDVLIPLASLGLLQPVLAAGTMAFYSVSVLTNSLLFRRYTPDHDYKLLGFLR